MASEWIKCISAHDKSMSIYINMALCHYGFCEGQGITNHFLWRL